MVFEPFLFSQKFTSRIFIIFLLHVQRFLNGRRFFCRTSAVILTFFFWPCHLRPFIYREVRDLSFAQTQFSPFKKKVLVAPAPLTILTKHIVRLRCRCSCEMCSTSAVPLLVIFETLVKPS